MPKSTDRKAAVQGAAAHEELLHSEVAAIENEAAAMLKEEEKLRSAAASAKEEIMNSQQDTKDQSAPEIKEEQPAENKSSAEKSAAKSQKEAKTVGKDKTDSGEAAKAISSLKGRTSMLTALSVLILLGLGGGGLYFYNEAASLKSANAALESRIAGFENALAGAQQAQAALNSAAGQIQALIKTNEELHLLNQNLAADSAKLQDKLSALANQEDNSEASLKLLTERLAAIESRDPNQWRLAESYFCIKNAYLKAIVGRDVKTALWNLDQADKIITGIEDEQVLALRSAIAKDRAVLEAVPQADLFGVRERINNLIATVDSLTLKGFSDKAEIDAAFAKESEPTTSLAQWKDNLLTSAKEFSSRFVEIRRRNPDNLSDFISPSAELFLRENIKTRLVLALSDLNSADAAAYKSNIAEAMRMVETYFDSESAVTQGALKALGELENANVAAPMPNTLESFALIQGLEGSAEE